MNIRVVEKHFKFPFQLHKYQLDTINKSVKKGSVLNRARVGEGSDNCAQRACKNSLKSSFSRSNVFIVSPSFRSVRDVR